ncbi:hypothetical protein FS842_008302 [Serendipita sp. 407]|nr:hypothetical protein FS842_008302 [Serendipita sp. 407]
MILLLAFSSLVLRVVKAQELVDPSTVADKYRSLPNIITGCVATILLCTWFSLHLNVPKPVNEARLSKLRLYAHKLWTFLRNGFFPFVVLLVAPEWVLMWALRQRLVVAYMVGNEKGVCGTSSKMRHILIQLPFTVPTRRHGFFIVMGGFHKFSRLEIPKPGKLLEDNTGEEPYGQPDHPLDRFDVCQLVDDGRFQLPPEVEIDDRSKSDWIAKSYVLIQTGWFVAQCIARKRQHLPLTELEVVTLGYALLNLFIYVIWWDKPQKVERPIRVFCGELPRRSEEQREIKRSMEAANWIGKLLTPVVGWQDQYTDLRSLKQTPTFYSGNPPPQNWPLKSLSLEVFAMMLTAIIGSGFGAIHFLAWSSPFQTQEMKNFWHLGSILMTGASFPMIILCIVGPFLDFLLGVNNNFVKAIAKWIIKPIALVFTLISMPLVPIAYIAGRVLTLKVAIQTLLAPLPPEVFLSVQWTNFIPHL